MATDEHRFTVRLDYPAALPGPGRYSVAVATADHRLTRPAELEVDGAGLHLTGDGFVPGLVTIELPEER